MDLTLLFLKYVFTNKFIAHTAKRMQHNLAIVGFHGLHTEAMRFFGKPSSSSTDVDCFSKNLHAIRAAYSIISLDEALDLLERRRPWKKHCAVLTFDDSLKSHATVAAPLLAALKIHATFFISTDIIERGRPYWWRRLEYSVERAGAGCAKITLSTGTKYSIDKNSSDQKIKDLKNDLKKLSEAEIQETVNTIECQLGVIADAPDPYGEVLSWEDVHTLLDMGMTIGGHTVSHANVTRLSENELRGELTDSKRTIQERCGISCVHFAFPYGIYSQNACTAVQAAGYRSALSMNSPGWNSVHSDRYSLGRFGAPKQAYKLPYIISGWNQTFNHLKKMIAGKAE